MRRSTRAPQSLRLLLALVCAGLSCSQELFSPDAILLKLHPPESFPPLYRDGINAFFPAEEAYRRGEYARTSQILRAFWNRFPAGSVLWERAAWPALQAGHSKGVNFGAPGCYYALRMLSEANSWREKAALPAETAPIRLSVILVGQSSGVRPAVIHRLHPLMAANAQAIVEQSTWLFGEYVRAMTDGRLTLQSSIIELPDLNVPVEITGGKLQFAGLADGAEQKIWQAVPEDVKAVTDWWWIIYPSHFPEESGELAGTEFITGGMGVGPDGLSPAFIIDDLWLLRKPSPYAGRTLYTEAERRAYMPQWFQHEFFHHLYRSYPEFKLEAKDHQWFDRKTWPADFEGRQEPDYYAESLHKRLQARGTPPLHVRLRYAPPAKELFQRITPEGLAGWYTRNPVSNSWHKGRIEVEGASLIWRNNAGRSWRLTLDRPNGVLLTGADNPYYYSNPQTGRAFRIVMRRGPDGKYLAEAAGFTFNGEFFARSTR